MRRFAWIIGAALPLVGAFPALAEDVVIRIEAKRGADAAQATALNWGAQFPDVVTFPLGDGWVGIALGPMPRDEAVTRLEQLKQERKVPGDSFLSPAEGRALSSVEAEAAPELAPAGGATAGNAGNSSTFSPGGALAAGNGIDMRGEPVIGDLAGEDQAEAASEAAPVMAPVTPPVTAPEIAPPAAPPGQYFLRIESSPDRARAEELLAKRRETLPEAALWTLPNGRSAVAFGPMDKATGEAWLGAFRRAEAVPKDAFLAPGEDMGELAIIGAKPDLGAPPAPDAAPIAMPPLEDIQRALRWAGHYDGVIDGKDGPMTSTAIAREIVRLRASPDTATAMAELIRRRDAWRAEIGLTTLQDAYTGLSLPAPMDQLQFDHSERALSIYGPKDGSGAALIVFSQPGGQQEMLDLAGLVTALGWVPAPVRDVRRGAVTLDGRNQTHIGHAEAKVVDGKVQGFVLIWPIQDPQEQRRIAAEISDNMARFSAGQNDVGQNGAPAITPPAAKAEPAADPEIAPETETDPAP